MSPLNPNFWVCLCEPTSVHSILESECRKCQDVVQHGRSATQQEVNEHAEQLIDQSQLVKQARHQLPEQRPKAPPTREQFEESVVWLEKDTASAAEWKAKGWYTHPQSMPPQRNHHESIVKRYKHFHDQSDGNITRQAA